jgi:hypothetical protein
MYFPLNQPSSLNAKVFWTSALKIQGYDMPLNCCGIKAGAKDATIIIPYGYFLAYLQCTVGSSTNPGKLLTQKSFF